jgi:hypothetical protein
MRFSKSCGLVFLVVAFAGGTIAWRNARAQEQKAPTLPLPEMQWLSSQYVGKWEYTETYPGAGQNTGIYTSELGPGGNSIFNHFHSKGPVGDFEGTLVMTWDAAEKAYKSYAFGADFPGALVGTGHWEGDTLVYRSEILMGSRKIALRNTTKFLEGGKILSEEYSSANGGPEKLLVHVEAARK